MERFKKQLEKEGYKHIFEWKDEPGEIYEEHAHKGRVCFFVVDGGLTMTFPDKVAEYTKGDRVDVPIGVLHSAVVGSEGCHYIVGEDIKGDS